MTDLQTQYRILVESTRLVASSYQIQIGCLPSYVQVPDEIALIYHEAFLLASQLVKAGWLDDAQMHRIAALDKQFDKMSANPDLWTVAALQQDVEWEDTRKNAQDILSMLNVSYAPPDLFWLSYIGTP